MCNAPGSPRPLPHTKSHSELGNISQTYSCTWVPISGTSSLFPRPQTRCLGPSSPLPSHSANPSVPKLLSLNLCPIPTSLCPLSPGLPQACSPPTCPLPSLFPSFLNSYSSSCGPQGIYPHPELTLPLPWLPGTPRRNTKTRSQPLGVTFEAV